MRAVADFNVNSWGREEALIRLLDSTVAHYFPTVAATCGVTNATERFQILVNKMQD